MSRLITNNTDKMKVTKIGDSWIYLSPINWLMNPDSMTPENRAAQRQAGEICRLNNAATREEVA